MRKRAEADGKAGTERGQSGGRKRHTRGRKRDRAGQGGASGEASGHGAGRKRDRAGQGGAGRVWPVRVCVRALRGGGTDDGAGAGVTGRCVNCLRNVAGRELSLA